MKQNQTEEIAIASFRKIVEPFIKYPKDLGVWAFSENGITIIQTQPHYADCGRITGKDKANLKAVSNIIYLIGQKNREHFRLNDPLPAKVGSSEQLNPFKADAKWNSSATISLLKEICGMFLSNHFEIEERAESEKTYLHITVSSGENLAFSVGQIAFSLSKIFHAIGKSRGRLIFITASEKTTKS